VCQSKLSGGRRYSGVPEAASTQAEATANNGTLGLPEGEVPSWEVRMLFDGDCPLCMREVDMLRGMDEGAPSTFPHFSPLSVSGCVCVCVCVCVNEKDRETNYD
jgi:hypothetical protein